jgi:hypothetical protein
MREFVSFLIPRRRACDTIADAASAQGRFHPAASQTPRDLVQFCLACRPPSASEIGLSRAFSRTPTGRSHPRQEPSNDCAARSKRERGGRSGIAQQLIAHQTIQAVEPLAHVGCARRKINPRRRAQAEHRLQPLKHSHKLRQRRRIEAATHFHSATVGQ